MDNIELNDKIYTATGTTSATSSSTSDVTIDTLSTELTRVGDNINYLYSKNYEYGNDMDILKRSMEDIIAENKKLRADMDYLRYELGLERERIRNSFEDYFQNMAKEYIAQMKPRTTVI